MDLLTIAFFVVALAAGIAIGIFLGRLIARHAFERQVPDIRKDAVERSRAVLSGQFSEQLAPYLPDFPYKPSEARFIGKPIDFIVFNGMDSKEINEVVFVEVKSRKSQMNKHEKNLRDTIKSGKVTWEEYRIPEDLTKKKE